MHKGGQGKSNSTPNTLLKGKGPGTSAAGPFKVNQKPIQCYNWGGMVTNGGNVPLRKLQLEGI